MTHAEPDAVFTDSQVIAGRYRLGKVIGHGGRAAVYEAVDPMLHRDVAVKVFRPSSTTKVDVRLQEAEARLIAGLNHYAVTTLFDAGVDTTDPQKPRVYLVMERIPGVDLKRRIQQDGPLTPAQVAFLGFDLAEGLQHVHEHGFLHRDIKPANVLLADHGIDSRIRGKLADFGISSVLGASEGEGWTGGTALYFSPEQADGQEPTTASDVYALGLVLLEALTGRTAFPGHQEDTVAARLDRDPTIPATVPTELAEVLRRMTALLPQDRPSLEDVALAFQTASLRDLVESGRVDPTTLATAEERRMALVRRYNILDTPEDDAFDRITHLACRLVDVPVAAVAVMDADREWFKSRRGIAVQEIDRDVALCAVTVTTGEPFTVPDVQAEARFAANPIVQQDPSLRAFASVPLATSDGHSIGTLCVFDRRVRTFTDQEIDDLKQLAAMAMRELDLRLASRRALFNR
jgi:tRNA A-37 threonylcarbamoyl transferase component Bud32